MTPEATEMQQYRDSKPCIGTDAFADLSEFAGRVVDAVDCELYQIDSDASILAVYLCGSFAEGTATRTLSDADVRVVLDEAPDMWTAEGINERLRVEHGSGVVENTPAGFLDAHLAKKHPEEFEHVKIWPEVEDA